MSYYASIESPRSVPPKLLQPLSDYKSSSPFYPPGEPQSRGAMFPWR